MPAKKLTTPFEKHVVHADSVITYVLATHLLIENLLIQGVSAKLQRASALFEPRPPNFAMLVSLAEALGVIEADFARVVRCINALRNKYAHRLSFEPEAKEIEALQKALCEMKQPFLVSLVPPSKREMTLMLASAAGYLQRIVEGQK